MTYATPSNVVSRTLRASLLVVLLAACGDGGRREGGLDRRRFVQVNVALRLLPDSATAAQRRAVLTRFHVTDAQMKGWLDEHRNNPTALADAWDSIAHRVDSLGMKVPPPAKTGGVPRIAVPGVGAPGDTALHAPPAGAMPVPPPPRSAGTPVPPAPRTHTPPRFKRTPVPE
jgi:hypothetical protein